MQIETLSCNFFFLITSEVRSAHSEIVRNNKDLVESLLIINRISIERGTLLANKKYFFRIFTICN